jgi:LacI family xylobiose transport system transcriptional regulator
MSHATPAKPTAGPLGEAFDGAATLADIARAAGVSTPTVSKVLNGKGDVAAPTRERVEALLREHRYRRRGPRVAPLLDLVFHELQSAWSLEVIRGAEKVAHEEGLSLVLTQSEGRSTPGQSWLDGVLARRPTGVVLVLSKLEAAQCEQLTTRDIPFAVIDPNGDLDVDVPTVGATNWQGGLAATRHLIELGHRRIGVVAGPARMLCSRARVDGYRAALETAGLRFDPRLVRHGEFHHETGYRLGRDLLQPEDRPTAVVAGNDLQALGVYEAARELDLRIPQDLSVVGFDDLPVARWVGPPLTTVRQPLEEMAATALRMVIGLARGAERTRTATRIELATELVVRSSTAAPSRA